ncbi:hypothetical protein BFR47_01720 [Oceanisphaera psychrotolerans]|uniref:Uncharacterized protein n=1 Tax=Oceanisphaera psychrotolerans TaxID=1414654 RepID=A0A1J4QIW0_9GAMM|nr:hypothetical protein BFR47_01720 [Oceanisphaera psychrotolerans]
MDSRLRGSDTNLNKDLIFLKSELRGNTASRQCQQVTLQHQGGQRDLLSRPSAPRMVRLSLQGWIYGESAE